MAHGENILDPADEVAKQAEHDAPHVELGVTAGDADLHGRDEASRLKALSTDVRDQDDLERDINRQVV